MGNTASGLPYSPPLDGIRAVAILAVLVFHTFPGALRGGFTGVDVFFVLSGFLIASIILTDIRDGTFSLREFYLRRIQRLLPNSVLTVLAVLVLWSVFLPPSLSNQVGRHSLWTLLNLSNFFIWRNFGGYWGDTARFSPLLHTWSLAVEEQFYLVFPASLALLARFQRNRVTRWLLAAAALSLALCIYLTPLRPGVSFYLLPTRIWELLLGAAFASYRTPLRNAIVPPALSQRLLETAGWLGLALVLAGFLLINEASGFPGAIALLPTIGALLIIVSVTGETWVSRFLSTRFMVGTGKLSYSLYLWHWPLITLGKLEAQLYGWPECAGAVAGAVAGIALASLAYVWVERPLRSRGPGRAWRLATTGCGFLFVILVSGWVATSHRKVNTVRFFDQPKFLGALYSAGKVEGLKKLEHAVRYQGVFLPSIDGKSEDTWRSGGIVHAFGKITPALVVLGSSHAMMYSSLIDRISQRLGVPVAFLCVDSTPVFFSARVNESFPTVSDAKEFDEARKHWLRTWHPRAVLVIDRWDLRQVENIAPFHEELRSFLSEVSPLTDTVFFVAQVPAIDDARFAGFNLREWAAWRMVSGSAPPRLFPDGNEAKRKLAVDAAEAMEAEFPNLRVLRPDKAFYRGDGSIRWISGRTVYYADPDHLSEAGAELVGGLFEGALAQASR